MNSDDFFEIEGANIEAKDKNDWSVTISFFFLDSTVLKFTAKHDIIKNYSSVLMES